MRCRPTSGRNPPSRECPFERQLADDNQVGQLHVTYLSCDTNERTRQTRQKRRVLRHPPSRLTCPQASPKGHDPALTISDRGRTSRELVDTIPPHTVETVSAKLWIKMLRSDLPNDRRYHLPLELNVVSAAAYNST